MQSFNKQQWTSFKAWALRRDALRQQKYPQEASVLVGGAHWLLIIIATIYGALHNHIRIYTRLEIYTLLQYIYIYHIIHILLLYISYIYIYIYI